MKDEEEQPHWDPSEAAAITVTLILGETVTSERPIDTPVVALEDCHHDHLDDDKSESADSLIALSSPMLVPANATPPTMKRKRTCLSQSLLLMEKLVIITNVTFPLSKLIHFCHTSFKCRNCNSVMGKKFTIRRYGIASSLYFECENCKFKTAHHTTLSKDLEKAKWKEKPAAKKFKDSKEDIVNASDFHLNNKLYLAVQQYYGGVLKEAKTIGRLLGLHSNALKG
jgi:hypothetical protein